MNINMVAPYEGALEWVGQPAEGVSRTTGAPWKSVDFTIMFLDPQMREQHLCFALQGQDLVNKLISLPLGSPLRVFWRPSSRSWTDQQGVTKWFASLQAFGFTTSQEDSTIGQVNAQPVWQSQPQPQYVPQGMAYAPQGGYVPPITQPYISQPVARPQYQQPQSRPQAIQNQQPATPPVTSTPQTQAPAPADEDDLPW